MQALQQAQLSPSTNIEVTLSEDPYWNGDGNTGSSFWHA